MGGVVSCVLIGLDLPDISILPGTFVFGFIGALLQAFSNFVALFRQIPQQRKAPGPRSVNASLQLRTHVTATAFAAAYTLLAYRGFAALHMPAILTLSFLAAGVNYFVFLGLLSSVAADEKAANPEKLVSSGPLSTPSFGTAGSTRRDATLERRFVRAQAFRCRAVYFSIFSRLCCSLCLPLPTPDKITCGALS